VVEQFRLPILGVHGVSHWGRVFENGSRIAAAAGADLQILELFALFHDACRLKDSGDREHGPRGAELAASLRGRIPLDAAAFGLLLEACSCHTRGPREGAPVTVRACLDADRLDIPRVGLQTMPSLLFTDAARDRRVISWAGRRAARRELPRLCSEQWGWRPSRPARRQGFRR
jgi:uncharacterized protein